MNLLKTPRQVNISTVFLEAGKRGWVTCVPSPPPAQAASPDKRAGHKMLPESKTSGARSKKTAGSVPEARANDG